MYLIIKKICDYRKTTKLKYRKIDRLQIFISALQNCYNMRIIEILPQNNLRKALKLNGKESDALQMNV